jgi:hypothetical protein
MIVLSDSDTLLPQWDRGMALIMGESPIFEIRITTSETGSILRAATEREVATKAEILIRKVHARGELMGITILGPSAAGTGRLKAYLEDVLVEVTRLSI